MYFIYGVYTLEVYPEIPGSQVHFTNQYGTIPESTRPSTSRPSFPYNFQNNWERGICIVSFQTHSGKHLLTLYQNKESNSSHGINSSLRSQIHPQSLRSQTWPNLRKANRHGGVPTLAHRPASQYHRMVCHWGRCGLEMDCDGVCRGWRLIRQN